MKELKELMFDFHRVEEEDLEILCEVAIYLDAFIYPSHLIAPGDDEYVNELREYCYEELKFVMDMADKYVLCPFIRNMLMELSKVIDRGDVGRFYEIAFLIRRVVEVRSQKFKKVKEILEDETAQNTTA